MTPDVSIVIPCRNEARRLPGTLRELSSFLGAAAFPSEVLVVVEPGRDPTGGIAGEWQRVDGRFRVILNPVARGKGYAVRTGMLEAAGAAAVFMDADLSVPLRFLGVFLDRIEAGADVVIGSRRHPQSTIACSQPLPRVVAGRAFNLALRLSGATRFLDTQCGFKAFSAAAARAIFPHVEAPGFGFDVEVLAIGGRLGLRIEESPVEWHDMSGSKVRPLRDGARAFAEALAGARRARRLRPSS
jgi:dolichyl-phosphate beta-glucosyltransferase